MPAALQLRTSHMHHGTNIDCASRIIIQVCAIFKALNAIERAAHRYYARSSQAFKLLATAAWH